MHRSGSSAITRGLEVLGADLGSHLMAADANNTKGYFEDIEFNQFNTRLLGANGHDWYTLSRIDKDDFKAEKFIPLKERAIELLKSKLARTDLLGIKDPRLCRLLPFWKKVFDALQLDVSYIIILRDPESIAASLFARDFIPRVKSLYLWLEHMIPVFRETMGCSRCVVDYDQLVSQPDTVIRNLADKLDFHAQLDQQALQKYATEFIDVTLKHHQGKPGPEAGFTSKPVRRLARLLESVSSQNTSIDSPAFIREIDAIDQAYRDRTDILAYIDTLDSIVIEKIRNLAEQGEQLDSLSTEYEETREALESSQQTISGLELQIGNLKTEIAKKDEQRASLEGLLNESRYKVESLERSLSNLHAQIGENEQRMEALEQRCESTTADAENLAWQLDEIHSGLFWRSSLVARKAWGYLAYVLKLKKEWCQAIPLNDLKRACASNRGWISTGDDPSFRLLPLSGAMPTGWVRIKASILVEPPESMFKLYLDRGEGFCESTTLPLPVSPTGTVDEIVHLPENLEAMRLDPMDHAGEFRLARIEISRINWLSRKLHWMKRASGAVKAEKHGS